MESSRPPWIIGTTFGLVATLVARMSFVAEGSVSLIARLAFIAQLAVTRSDSFLQLFDFQFDLLFGFVHLISPPP